ncbi:MAG: hypothetical protein CMA70_04695 [Euryarchaeota archaeon]|jgi:hypothetical protein|nr:hypothetical protein [Euryarchaeota archaeon]|tara:strand:- start:279 stop:887 length:609 start_codon:yes stop_codon:yes gene_type:complete
MERAPEDGKESPRIDVRTLPESIARLWETMLRLDPSWNLASWLDERALEELELVESHLGRERLRLEQRLHRIETLVKRLKRQREVVGTGILDPHQKNLFDVYEANHKTKESEDSSEREGEPAVDFGSFDVGDDPLLAIVSEHVLGLLELKALEGPAPVHFDTLMGSLIPLGMRVDDLDEAVAWLLQSELIIEIEEDSFSLSR